MIKLREYQKKAVDYALKNKKSVLVLPTGSGKTIIGCWFLKTLFEENKINRAIVLVPTRILVEQTHKMYLNLGIRAKKIYGILKKEDRKELWKEFKVVISTPETVINDIDLIQNIDAIIIDECHHAVGEDAYAKVLKEIDVEYKLGLTPYIPRKRRREIELLIGEIKEWEKEDIKPYMPEWIGEIIETPFTNQEYFLYEKINYIRSFSKNKFILTLALRYFAKEGPIALKETLERKNKISQILKDFKKELNKCQDLHKIDHLKKILNIYDGFDKCIIFVDRIVVAKTIFKELKNIYSENITLIMGRQKDRIKEVLEEAKYSKIIISTSAGEEGLDLPSADLLINWSNTSSPLRFIQRHGRIMRKTNEKTKFVVYLVTPYTIDSDDLIASIDEAKKIIDVNIDSLTLKELWKKSKKREILELLEKPLEKRELITLSGMTQREVSYGLKRALQENEIVYIYRNNKKLYLKREKVLELIKSYKNITPQYEGKVKAKKENRIISIKGNYFELLTRLEKQLPIDKIEITTIKKSKEIIEYEFKKYDFKIFKKEELELILKNALTD